MAAKQKHICNHPGCGEITDQTVCPRHQSARDDARRAHMRDYNARRRKMMDVAVKFYATAEWRSLRDGFIARYPFCTTCGRPALYVDHRKPIKDGGAALDEANLQSQCAHCHGIKTSSETKRRGA